MRLYASNKTISKEYYVTDQNINLIGLDWIDELNFIPFTDKNKTYLTLTLEPMNAENLIRGCNQCLHAVKSLILLFLLSCRNQVLPGLRSNLPPYDDRFTFKRVRYYSAPADNKQISHLHHQQTL